LSSIPDILKVKDYERLVSGIQTISHNDGVLCDAIDQLSRSMSTSTRVDLNQLSKTGDPTFIDILAALMQGNLLSVPIQEGGTRVLSRMCCSLRADFPSHLTIPVATILLRNMDAYPKAMYIQCMACLAFNNLSKQPHNEAILDTMCNAGGFDLVELVLAFSRTGCLTIHEASIVGINGTHGTHFLKKLLPLVGAPENAEGTLGFIFEFLTRFAGNWSASPRVVAAQQGGIEDGIIRRLSQLCNSAGTWVCRPGSSRCSNVAQFNQTNIECISTVLQIMQTTPLTNNVHSVVCRTLQSFIGGGYVTRLEPQNINKRMQSNMGDTGVIPLVLRGIKYR